MKLGILLLSSKIFFCWILLLVLFILVGGLLFGDLGSISLLDLANWDGRHFLSIAQFGYLDKTQHAFFPLYPLLINLFASILTIDFLSVSILINLILVFWSIYLFLEIQNNNLQNSIKTVLYFLIFPTAYYLISVYSESLFLFLTLLVFFLAQKKKLLLAAIIAALASLTRISGIALLLSLWVYIFNSNLSLGKKTGVILISISGFLTYCIYLYLQTGNPFYFLISELTWGRSIELPGFNVRDSLLYMANEGIRPESFTIFSDLLFTVFGLGLAIRAIRFLKPPFVVYAITALFIPLTTALLLSIPRFLIIVFPIFMVLSLIKNRIFNISYVIISLTLLFLYFNFFIRNIWVS